MSALVEAIKVNAAVIVGEVLWRQCWKMVLWWYVVFQCCRVVLLFCIVLVFCYSIVALCCNVKVLYCRGGLLSQYTTGRLCCGIIHSCDYLENGEILVLIICSVLETPSKKKADQLWKSSVGGRTPPPFFLEVMEPVRHNSIFVTKREN